MSAGSIIDTGASDLWQEARYTRLLVDSKLIFSGSSASILRSTWSYVALVLIDHSRILKTSVRTNLWDWRSLLFLPTFCDDYLELRATYLKILQFPKRLLFFLDGELSMREEIKSLVVEINVFANKTTSFEHDSQWFTNLNFRIVDLHQKLKKRHFGQLWKLWFQSHSKASSFVSKNIYLVDQRFNLLPQRLNLHREKSNRFGNCSIRSL